MASRKLGTREELLSERRSWTRVTTCGEVIGPNRVENHQDDARGRPRPAADAGGILGLDAGNTAERQPERQTRKHAGRQQDEQPLLQDDPRCFELDSIATSEEIAINLSGLRAEPPPNRRKRAEDRVALRVLVARAVLELS